MKKSDQKPFRRRAIEFSAAAAALTALGAGQPAFAQSGGADPANEVEQVVVTALKSDVKVQEAPVTINVASGEKLQQRTITSIEQMTSGLPGIRIQQAPQGSITTVVRGLGSSPSANTFDQTVGFFIDGVYAGHGREYSSALFDVNRIELLKGTQSAVVGKGTSMGALALVTNRPAFENGGSLSAYQEFELDTTTVNAVLNLALTDQIALRIAGLVSHEGGWMKNELLDEDWPIVKREGVRVALRVAPNDRLDWTVYGQYSELRLDGQYFRTGVDTAGFHKSIAAFRGDPNFTIAPYTVRATPRSGDANNPRLLFTDFDTPGSAMTAWRFVSNGSYDLGPATLTFVTGYSTYDEENIIDALGQAQMPRVAGGIEHNDQFSQEFRLATNGDGPLSAMAGVYYWHDDWDFSIYSDQTPTAATGFTGNNTGAYSRGYSQKTRSTSAFGQVTFKPTDRIWLIGGLRYEHYKKTGSFDGVQVLRLPPGSTFLAGGNLPFAPFSVTNDKDFFDYSVQAQYFFTPDLQAYASFATASKGFGYQLQPTSGIPGDPSFLQDPYFAPELSETFEAGFKWALGAAGHLNAAFFNTEIKDFQTSFRRPDTVVVIRNDQIRSRGVEASAAYQLFDGLTASVTATYAEVKKTTPVAGSISTLILSPKWSGIGEVSYARPLTDTLSLSSNLTFEFRSSQFVNDSLTAALRTDPGRVRTDLRIGVAYEPRDIEVALIVRNVFDVRGITYSYASPFGGAAAADEMPRTIGVQARVRF